MTVADYNETPFARRPRIHHKDAAEGPSSAGFARRNLVGMMGVMMSSGAKAWTNPYVTNGLLAMWDGEWNAGRGKHDANATEWTDLSGNGRLLTIPSSWLVNDTYIEATNGQSTGVDRIVGDYESMVDGDGYTIELVADIPSGKGTFVGLGPQCTLGSWSDTLYRLVTSNNYNGVGTYGVLYPKFSPFGKKCVSASVKINGPINFFVNNTKSIISSTAGGVMGDLYPKYVGFTIQGNYVGSNDGPSNGGKYYSVRIYSRPLTDAEIAANYAVDKARFGL